MDETLSQFARHIKERPRYLESKEDLDELRRKMLCTQTSDVKAVYPWVASDYEGIDFRSPNALHKFHVSPEYMDQVLSQVKMDADLVGNQSVLEHFVAETNPPVGKELFAYFGKHRSDMLDHLTVNMDVQPRSDMIKRMREYKSHHPDEVEQMGRLIRSMTWPEISEMVDLSEPIAQEPRTEAVGWSVRQPATVERLQVALPVDEPVTFSLTPEQEENVKQYKLEAGIGLLFPAKKVITQRLIGAYNESQARDERIMGKHQTEYCSAAVPEDHYELVREWPVDVVERLVALEPLQNYYYSLKDKPKEGRALLRQFLKHESETLKKYEKPEQLPKEMVEAMIQHVVQ